MTGTSTTTTTPIEPNPYVERPMVLNGVFIGMIGLRDDQIDYFGFSEPTAAELALVTYTGKISAHKRNIYSERLDSTTVTRTIDVGLKSNIRRVRKKLVSSRGGKPIILPTELTSTPASTSTDPNAPARRASIRKTTIRFPGAASNAEISAWLDAKITSHQPSYFITPSGAHYPILPAPAATTPPATGT